MNPGGTADGSAAEVGAAEIGPGGGELRDAELAPVGPRAILGRDAVLAADDLATRFVPVPEWGGGCYVRVMTGTERDEYETACFAEPEVASKHFRALLLVRTVCDADGALLFGPDDVERLSGKSIRALNRLWSAAMEMNALATADVETAKND